MKQYRISSDNFQNNSTDDAVMHPDDLAEIKRLAGLPVTEGGPGVLSGIPATPRAAEDGIISPVGSNISTTAQERNELEREYHARPGTDLWFIINFTLPKLTGSVRDHVEAYLKKHPEHRPKNFQ
jgi:hypothetical protein